MRSRFVLAVALLLIPATVHAQEKPPTPDAELRADYDRWQADYQKFADAMAKARAAGKLGKGAELPPEVRPLQQAAEAGRDALLQRFAKRDDLKAPVSHVMLGRLHEQVRDYHGALAAYERSLRLLPADKPELTTLAAACIAALNTKDDALAAKWMRTTIEAEDRAGDPNKRDLQVRTLYLPRTLIALDDWSGLDALLARLAADPAKECKAAATTFGVLASLHRQDLAAARQQLLRIRQQPKELPDQQSWAVLALLALMAHDGEFDAGAAMVRDFLAEKPAEPASALDGNWRRLLAAIAPFLGKPAPALRVDHWSGPAIAGAEPLAALRGKVVVLDFWQPWCEPCRRAMPELVRLQKEHGERLQVLGVCKVEDYGYDVSEKKAVRPIAAPDYPAHIDDFRKDMDLPYPVAIADTADNDKAYAIAGVPTLVVLDRKGVVRYMSCGAGESGLFAVALQGVLDLK